MSWWNPSSLANTVDNLEQYIPVAGPWLQQANRGLGLIGGQNQSQGNSVDDLVKRMQAQAAASGNATSPIQGPNGMSGVDLINHLYQQQQQNGGGALSANPNPSPNPSAPGQSLSPLDTLLGDLYKGLGTAGQPGMMTPAQIRAQAQKQVNAQYDPQIQAILNQISGTKKTTASNQKSIGDLYNSLAGSFGGDVATSTANTKAAKSGEASALKELQKGLSSQYADSASQQAKELGKLGLSDILPSTTANQKADMQFLSNLNNTNSSAQQQAIDSIGLADKNFYNQGSGIAKTEGAEGISNLTQQLNDYLNQQSQAQTDIEGQKNAALQQLIAQTTSSQAGAQSKFQSEQWNRALQLAQLQESLNKQGANPNVPTSGMLGATAIAQQVAQKYGSPEWSNGYVSNLMNLLQTPDFQGNQFLSPVSNQFVNMNPQQGITEARAYAKANNLNPGDTDTLVKMLLAYMGKMK